MFQIVRADGGWQVRSEDWSVPAQMYTYKTRLAAMQDARMALRMMRDCGASILPVVTFDFTLDDGTGNISVSRSCP